jgi:hypothetical protein
MNAAGKSAANALWRELLQLLDDRNQLPANASTLTPAELVTEVVKKTNDARIRSFVEDYYYPRHFGGETSGMTDAQARDLFEWIAAGIKQAEFPREAPVRDKAKEEKICEVCKHRPAEKPRDLQSDDTGLYGSRSSLSLFQKESR